MLKVILWDVDGTLLDFDKAEYAALRNCFEKFGLGVCTDEMIERYVEINKKYWVKLEQGEITRQQVLIGRFEEFFELENIRTDCVEEFNAEYQCQLGANVFFCDDSYELVKSLKGKVKQYAVTNGSKVAQDGKLNKSGLIHLFDDVFISETVGVDKPAIAFFDYVWERIGRYESDEVVIIGDSLTSDMQGGNNAGIRCCWYNPKGLENKKNLKIDWEIRNLNEILSFL